jgi:hypothetical protein
MMMRRLSIALALGITVAGAAVSRAAPKDVKPAVAALTAADYIEIQQLAVRYSYALDTGARAGELFADLFAPDGAFISATRGRIEGRDKLVALGRGRTPMYPRRYITNHVIESTAEGVKGHVYVIEIEFPSEGEKLGGELTPTGGRYEDVYEKTRSGWRFKSREFVPSKMAVPGAPRS